MPAKDLYHDTVKAALEKDGWTITHDPLTLRWGKKDLFVDLGAERLLAAEREGRKIAVEVKSFLGRSEMDDLENALGQYVLYYKILQRIEPDRDIYLAVQELTFIDVFQEDVGRLLLEDQTLRLLVFDVATQEIVRWIP